MSKSQIKEYSDQYADILIAIDDLRVELKAIEDAAKEAGINIKAMRKVAKELTMESAKLTKRLEDEDQLSLFRDEVGLIQRKGLAPTQRQAA